MIKAGYKETELGEIPEEWEIVELNNVADHDSNKSPLLMWYLDSNNPLK